MAWLTPEDHAYNKRAEQSAKESFARASHGRRLVKVCVTLHKQYPHPTERRTLDLPKPMTESEAYSYLDTIAHDKSNVSGFYCDQGFYHQVKRY